MASYLENLIKEAKQYANARNKTGENSAKGSSYPPNVAADGGKGREYYSALANAARKQEDSAFGQMFGALLQGRRYDDKTGKLVKAKKK
jgi:hypothetical protein